MPNQLNSSSLNLYQISPQGLITISVSDLNDVVKKIKTNQQYWLDVVTDDRQLLIQICEHFNLHQGLVDAISDLSNQIPKADIYDNYVFWTVRFFETEETKRYHFKKIATLIIHNLVMTFRCPNLKFPPKFLDKINEDFKDHHVENADYLALLFLDMILDFVFSEIDDITEQVQFLEEIAIKNPKNFNLKDIYVLKRKILFLRKLISPIMGVASMLKNNSMIFLHRRAQISLSRVYDLCFRAGEILDLYQQMITNIYDMYLSTTNFYTNRSITVLTQFSTVFIPISFVTGIYGMNFRHMPEIYYTYSYPIVLFGMAAMGVSLWYCLKKYLDM